MLRKLFKLPCILLKMYIKINGLNKLSNKCTYSFVNNIMGDFKSIVSYAVSYSLFKQVNDPAEKCTELNYINTWSSVLLGTILTVGCLIFPVTYCLHVD